MSVFRQNVLTNSSIENSNMIYYLETDLLEGTTPLRITLGLFILMEFIHFHSDRIPFDVKRNELTLFLSNFDLKMNNLFTFMCKRFLL